MTGRNAVEGCTEWAKQAPFFSIYLEQGQENRSHDRALEETEEEVFFGPDNINMRSHPKTIWEFP